jgi:hypothetical protein
VSDRNYDFCDDPLNELVAADARVEELEDELAEAQSKILCWISVEERLPELDWDDMSTQILVLTADRMTWIGRYEKDEHGERWYVETTQPVVAWMPIPEPPEVK